jgi:beta-glucosidase/6-phospho-beta-glucosidase/beta-galactosidase
MVCSLFLSIESRNRRFVIGDAVYPWDPEDPLDVEAAERKLEFSISWFADPVYFGHYPESMVSSLSPAFFLLFP